MTLRLDTIFDFENNRDVDLTRFHGITRFGQVRTHSSQSGGDVVIDLGAAGGRPAGANMVTLVGLTLADRNKADFLFA